MFLLRCADTALGRCDPQSLDEQTKMELLVSDIYPVRDFQDKEGLYFDACAWSGVRCDEQQNVTSINWMSLNPGGPIALDYLPAQLVELNISTSVFAAKRRNLTGTVSTAALPEGLLLFIITRNGFYGTLDLPTMPQKMEKFGVEFHKFEGSVELAGLPNTLLSMNLSWNAFCGTVNLSALPSNMQHLFLSNNTFEGSLQLENLPTFLQNLGANGNNFSGTINLCSLPQGLSGLSLERNPLSGGLDFSNLPPRMRMLSIGRGQFDEVPEDALPHGVIFSSYNS